MCFPNENMGIGRGRYGVGNDSEDINFSNLGAILIVGAGAFAAENARTALERGMGKVSLL
jgi:hypothetical protein